MNTLLQRLRNFDAQQHELDELVALSAEARVLSEEHARLGLDEPLWLTDVRDKIAKEAESRNREMLEKELREIQGRQEALKTSAEKRQDLSEREARIKAKLSGKPTAVAA